MTQNSSKVKFEWSKCKMVLVTVAIYKKASPAINHVTKKRAKIILLNSAFSNSDTTRTVNYTNLSCGIIQSECIPLSRWLYALNFN